MGANSNLDGLSGVHTHMTNSLNTPLEALENYLPIRITTYALRRGSGGSGARRGGEGIIREYEFLEQTQVSIISERRKFAPYGAQGGQNGRKGRNILISSENKKTILNGKVNLKIKPHERLRIETPGGGGYGQKK